MVRACSRQPQRAPSAGFRVAQLASASCNAEEGAAPHGRDSALRIVPGAFGRMSKQRLGLDQAQFRAFQDGRPLIRGEAPGKVEFAIGERPAVTVDELLSAGAGDRVAAPPMPVKLSVSARMTATAAPRPLPSRALEAP